MSLFKTNFLIIRYMFVKTSSVHPIQSHGKLDVDKTRGAIALNNEIVDRFYKGRFLQSTPRPGPTVIPPRPTVIPPRPTVIPPRPTVSPPRPTVSPQRPTVRPELTIRPRPTARPSLPPVLLPQPTVVPNDKNLLNEYNIKLKLFK